MIKELKKIPYTIKNSRVSKKDLKRIEDLALAIIDETSEDWKKNPRKQKAKVKPKSKAKVKAKSKDVESQLRATLEMLMDDEITSKKELQIIQDITVGIVRSTMNKMKDLGLPILMDKSEKVFAYMKKIIPDDRQEHFYIILLDGTALMGVKEVSVGTLEFTLVHPREVFIEALKAKASAIVAAHNHPGFDTTPSKEDIKVTKALIRAGKLLGIELRDHIIIGKNSFTSMQEKYGGAMWDVPAM